jgi:hypothetical protein
METKSYKLCFIISHKYYRNYTSYIQYYIDNIQKFYPGSLCIIVDNNTTHINDIIIKLKEYKNVVILTNASICKFEIGAYKVGISYLLNNNLIDKYDYTIFSQDNFVLKNKYDFNELRNQNITACSLTIGDLNNHGDLMHVYQSQIILKKLNLLDSIEKIGLCWCNSFILHNLKIKEFFDITKDIIITQRIESEWSERYLAAILYYLNNNRNYGLNGIYNYKYNCCSVNIFEDEIDEYFVKNTQHKNELTIDL